MDKRLACAAAGRVSSALRACELHRLRPLHRPAFGFRLACCGPMCIGPEPQAGTALAMEPLKGKRVAVVGSGISGLGAAWLLHRQGAACMRGTNDPAMFAGWQHARP